MSADYTKADGNTASGNKRIEDPHERALDKIRKIKAMMEGAKSEGEAQTFAAMMQRMMLQHNIDMTDIEVERMEMDEPVTEQWFNPEGKDAKAKRTRSYWMEDLAAIVARAHFCDIAVNEKTSLIMLIGRKSNIEVAEFMVVTLSRLVHKMALREWWKEWRRRGGDESYAENRRVREELKGFRVSYVKSFTRRLAERYAEERRKATQGPDATSTAMVRVNRAEAATKAFMAEKFKDSKPAKEITKFKDTSHAAGWRAGREAADKIDLGAGGKAIKTKEQEALEQSLCGQQRCHRATEEEVKTQRICPVCEEPLVVGQPVHRTVDNLVIVRHCACDKRIES
jgi:hypothetical protein